jgi:hypothetical protein
LRVRALAIFAASRQCRIVASAQRQPRSVGSDDAEMRIFKTAGEGIARDWRRHREGAQGLTPVEIQKRPGRPAPGAIRRNHFAVSWLRHSVKRRAVHACAWTCGTRKIAAVFGKISQAQIFAAF